MTLIWLDSGYHLIRGAVSMHGIDPNRGVVLEEQASLIEKPSGETKDVFEVSQPRIDSHMVTVPFKSTTLDTESQQLSVLLQVQDQVPNIFKDAANYDIKLFALLEEQKTLVASLVTQPGYSEAMAARKLVSMEIKPPAEGITVQAKTLKPEALSGWKASLNKALADEQKPENLQKPPLDHIDSEIKRLLAIANPESAAKAFLDPRNILPKDASKELQKKYTEAMKAVKDSPIREKLLKVKELFPGKSAEIDSVIAGLDIPETLGRLSELRVILSGDPEPETWEEAKNKIEALSQEQLIYFDDKEDVLKQKIVDHISEDQAGRITDLVFKRVHAFASQEESRAQTTTASVILREAPPIVAIFRGCIGGDCSSQFSFPYPNDPHERVFFIEDSEGKTKGYVSGTTVVKDGKKYLYLITVSGARVSAGDTELIFRGLYQQRALLGVEGILLPENSKLGSLVNYPQARGRYEAYARKGTPQAFSYQNPEIRKSIEDFSSDRNRGYYDHMSNNTQGVELSFNAKELKNLSSSVVHVPPASIDSQPIDSSSKEQILDFAINMHTSHREEMKTQLLSLPEVNKMISKESLDALLESAKAAQPGESLEQFKNRVSAHLKTILGDEARAKTFLEQHIEMLFPAALLCSDAFEKANLEQTAEQVLKYTLSAHLEGEFIVPGLEKITTTAAFAKWKRKALEALKQAETDEDFEETFLHVLKIGLFKDDELSEALWSLNNTYPKLILKNIENGVAEHLSECARYLTNSNSSVRRAALNALCAIKLTDVAIQRQVLGCLSDPNKDVREAALYVLIVAIMPTMPTDVTIQRQVLGYLSDPNKDVREAALYVLTEIEITDPGLQRQIIGYLTDSDPQLREAGLAVLPAIRPTDVAIQRQIVEYLKDPNDKVRKAALAVLGAIELTDPGFQRQIIGYLTDLRDDDELLKVAAKALGTIKPTDLEIQKQIASCLLHSNKYVSEAATKVLSIIKPTDVAIQKQIASYLTDPDYFVRENIAHTLSIIKPTDPEVQRQIMGYLTDSNYEVREAAAKALGAIKPTDVAIQKQIASCLTDPNDRVREAAAKALGTIKPTDPEVQRQIIGYLTDSNDKVCEAALDVLGSIKPTDVAIQKQIQTCMNAFSDKRRNSLNAQIVALAAFNAEVVINPRDLAIQKRIASGLLSRDDKVRKVAVQALKTIEPMDLAIQKHIAGLLVDSHWGWFVNTCPSILEVLMAIKPADADPEIKKQILLYFKDFSIETRDLQDYPIMLSGFFYALLASNPTDLEIQKKIIGYMKEGGCKVYPAIATLALINPMDLEIQKEIASCLTHSKPDVHTAAVAILAAIKATDPTIKKQIADCLKSSDNKVFEDATSVLTKLRIDAAV